MPAASEIYSGPKCASLLRFVRCSLAGIPAALATFTALASALEPSRNGFGFGAPPSWAPSPPPLAIFGRLAAAVGAVRRLTLAFLDLLAHRRRLPRLDDRVGDGVGDQLHGPNRVVIPRDRHRDEVRIGVRVGDGDDRDVELIRLVDGD